LLDEVALPLIQQDLKSPDTKQNLAAANACRHIGEEAIPVLVHALKTANDSVRFAIELSLGQMGPAIPKAVSMLIPLLNAGDGQPGRNARLTLEHLRTPEALEAVRAYDEEQQEDPGERLLRLMESWARRSNTTRTEGYRLVYGELLRRDGKRLLEPKDTVVERYIENALLQLGDKLSEAPAWDVMLEEGESLAGLFLKATAPGLLEARAAQDEDSKNLEIVFDRATREVVLVIGGDD
jgi:HEAT repeat protein